MQRTSIVPPSRDARKSVRYFQSPLYTLLYFFLQFVFYYIKYAAKGRITPAPLYFFQENDTGMVFFMLSLWEYRSYLDFSFTKVSDAFLFCIVKAAVPEAIFRGSVPYAGATPFMMWTFSVFARTSFR